MNRCRVLLELYGLITIVILGSFGFFTSFVKLEDSTPSLDPLGPLDDENRPHDDPNGPPPGLATLSNTAIERAASKTLGWTWLERDVEPDHAPLEPFAQI